MIYALRKINRLFFFFFLFSQSDKKILNPPRQGLHLATNFLSPFHSCYFIFPHRFGAMPFLVFLFHGKHFREKEIGPPAKRVEIRRFEFDVISAAIRYQLGSVFGCGFELLD